MNPKLKIKINNWFIKIDLSIWIDADFECMNFPINDPQRKALFVKKPIGVGFNIVKE